MSSNLQSAFEILSRQPWAITPDTLQVMCSIAQRDSPSIEALEAKLGRPLMNTRIVSMRNDAAVVPVNGPIFRYANLFTQISGATSLDILARDFTTALENPDVARVILSFDTPGGQANGISEFAQMIRNRTIRKPVIAYVENAMSAGYWLASAADEIVMHKTSLVGSIGAVVAINNDPKSKAGVIEIVSSQSPKKRPDVSTAEGRSQIQTVIDNLAQVFIEDVAAHRGVTVDTVMEQFGQGDVRMGAEAVSLGMADRIATLEQVISRSPAQSVSFNTTGAQVMSTVFPTTESEARKAWEENPSIRAEFKFFGAYWGYCQVEKQKRLGA